MVFALFIFLCFSAGVVGGRGCDLLATGSTPSPPLFLPHEGVADVHCESYNVDSQYTLFSINFVDTFALYYEHLL